jgi:predicted GH43/DUF377 family glycosyl hydrolase
MVGLLMLTASALRAEPPSTPAMMYGDSDRLGRPFAKDPSVIRFDNRYLLYYSMAAYSKQLAPPGAPKGWAIGVAESTDLVHWKKIGEILPRQPCERNGIVNGRAILLDGKLHLFYNTYGNFAKDALCHAVSADGLHFDRDPTNPVWHPTGSWNLGRAIDLDVVEWGDRLVMYYATRDPTGKIQMLHAVAADRRSDFSRTAWKPLCDGPILKPELPWETRCIEAPSVIKRGDTLYLFYGGGHRIGLRTPGCRQVREKRHHQCEAARVGRPESRRTRELSQEKSDAGPIEAGSSGGHAPAVLLCSPGLRRSVHVTTGGRNGIIMNVSSADFRRAIPTALADHNQRSLGETS